MPILRRGESEHTGNVWRSVVANLKRSQLMK